MTDESPALFWIALAVLLTVSSTLNAYQVVAAEDVAIRLGRRGLIITFLLLGALSLRKGLAARASEQEGTQGAMAAAKAARQGMIPVLAVVIVTIIAIGAAIAARGPRLSMPESLAGYSRVHGSSIDDLEHSFESDVGGISIVGVYGAATLPRFMVAGFDTVPEPGTDTLSGSRRVWEYMVHSTSARKPREDSAP